MRAYFAAALATLLSACGSVSGYEEEDGNTPKFFDEIDAPSLVGTSDILRVRARGTAAGRVYPNMQVSIDGEVIDDVDVTRRWATYDFALPKAANAVTRVGVRFTNDAVIRGADRNLEIDWINLGTLAREATDDDVVYDRFAEDGKDVLAGQELLAWTGTLIFTFTPTDDGDDEPTVPTDPTDPTDPTEPTDPTDPPPALGSVCDTSVAAGANSHVGIDPGACTRPTTCSGVNLNASMTAAQIQQQIDANANGTTFCFAAGTYRLEDTLYPKTGNKLIGLPGARLNGARVIPAASITKQGNQWIAANVTTNLPTTGPAECRDESTLCLDQNQVYVGNKFLIRVGSKAAVTPGYFFIDAGAKQVVVADDPTTVGMELSRTDWAIWGGGRDGDETTNDVTISGLVIEKYGSAGQRGAIFALNGTGWNVSHNEIANNHGLGLAVNHGITIRCNDIHHNGEMGVGGDATNGLFENNVLAYNNSALYNDGWEGGGVKFAVSTNLRVLSNWVHHNRGPGLWTDIDNLDIVYQNNLTEDNEGPGIFHEISFKATIGHNTSRRNGLIQPWFWGAGILIAASQDVEVCSNLVEANSTSVMLIDQGRGTSENTGRAYMVANDYVHDNVMVGDQGVGAVQDQDDPAIFTRNNRFVRNQYRVQTVNDTFFQWNDNEYNFAGWQGLGQDAGGSIARQ